MKEHEIRFKSTKSRLDLLVDYRWVLASIVAALTLLLTSLVPNIKIDPSIKSVLVTSSPSYYEYQGFREFFDDDEYVVIAIKPQNPVLDSNKLSSLDRITQSLVKIDGIVEVLSLTNLRVLQKRGEVLANQTLMDRQNDQLSFPTEETLQKISKALPIFDLLLSPDRKSIGILIRITEELKFDHASNTNILAQVREIVKSEVPADTDFRVVGQAQLRQAILKYTLKTALIFGVLCTLICLTVTGYVFRNVTVTVVTIGILGLCVLWVLGLMAFLDVPLNPTTSLSFGLILITTLEMVIHLVTRYNQFRQDIPDRVRAVKETVRYLSRPFFICSATTAVGFGSCMITSIPMVFQLGLIMSLGISISFCLTMIIMPTLIIAIKTMDVQVSSEEGSDGASNLLNAIMNSIRRYHRLYTVGGFVIIFGMLLGVPFIRSDPQVLHQLGETRPEVKDVRFVEANLASIHSVQLMLEFEEGALKKPDTWKKIKELETRLRAIPEVVSTDSLLPMLEYVGNMLGKDNDDSYDLFRDAKSLPYVLFFTSMSSDGKRLIRKHVDDEYKRLNITVRINNAPEFAVMDTVEKIQKNAQSLLKENHGFKVTGELVIIAAQGEDLIKSEIQSMFLAIGIIAILMMFQMGAPLFGLISLIPNIPPVATVFGIMGFMKIPLDGVTVFAATVAIGLAVDNTIQFIAQLKREIRLNPGSDVESCMFKAYRLAAKPMASWSLVTLLGFLAMLATPFQAAVSFGMLVASAVFMGIFGDLIFMQSMILTFPKIKQIIQDIVQKESSVVNR